jgi:putative ABC transport system permease protein
MMNGLPPVEKTIVVTTNYQSVNSALQGVSQQASLTPANLDDVTTQLHRDFGAGPLPLAPQSADWAAMTSGPRGVLAALPALRGIPAQVEVTYPYPVAGHMRLVAGRMPDTSPASGIQVVVTAQTASAWGLRPGSQVAVIAPLQTTISGNGPPSPSFKLNLDVTGIVEPIDPDSSFWKADPLLAAPNLYVSQSKLWEGAFIADPGEIATMQDIFGQAGLSIRWEFPVATAGLRAQAPALYSEMKQFTLQTPQLTGLLAPMSNALSTSSALLGPLATLVAVSNGVNVLLWMVYVGLAVAGVVMMLLAARMVAARRAAEMAVRRARGASLTHLFWRTAFGAAVACGPAAALAWALAVLLVPGPGPTGWVAWWPGIATLAVAVLGPGAAAAWQHRLPHRRRSAGRDRARWRRRWATRVIFEVTACAAAIGGIIVLRQQGGGGDLYTSAAPLLVAVPAVIVVLRLYQPLLRGLARASARRRGAIGFLGLTRAAQATATLALPAITLVLTLTMAAFTIMVRDAVVRGEIAASWQETGADVAITSAPGFESGPAVRAFAAVPGVQHAATALELPLDLTGGERVTAIAVDPASYATLVASTEGYSPVDPALLTQAPGQAAVPVLASPAAAAILGRQGSVPIAAQQGLPALRVRVSGELQSTPALPGGGTFLVLPLSAIGGVGAPVNVMLLTGPSIDISRLHAVQATTPGADDLTITTRSQALQELTGAPLQHGTFLIFTLAIVCALALALAVMLLELALSTADRELTMAKLATMGLDERQRVRLSVLEAFPAIAASAVAAVACAIALPRLVAPAINLSAFTQSQATVPLRPDFASFLLPLAGLLAVTVIALGYEIRSRRGRVAATLRA